MAVLIRRLTRIAGEEVELKTYHPAGSLTKEDRLRADRLDLALQDRLSGLAQQALKRADRSKGWIHLYFLLGRKIREIVDDQSLVSPVDIQNGIVWRSVWEYLPKELKNKNRGDASSYEKMQKNGFDPLALAYVISKFQWEDIKNIRRQDDWNHLSHRPAVFHDERILKGLSEALGELTKYPSRSEFHSIVKKIGEVFPSRNGQDSSVVLDDEIVNRIRSCVFLRES